MSPQNGLVAHQARTLASLMDIGYYSYTYLSTFKDALFLYTFTRWIES